MSDVTTEPLLQLIADYASRYRASLAERPVAARLDARSIELQLGELRNQATEGLAPEAVIAELLRLAEPGITAMSGPRFFGWVIGGTLPAALAADWLTSTWDQNAGTGAGAPAATAFENTALAWVIELLGLPQGTAGALVTGAMLANFTGLAAARSQLLEFVDWDVQQRGLFGAPAIEVFVGHERHETIDKAVRLLGLGKQAIRCIETDGQGRMRASALDVQLQRCEGLALICAQAGNVNSGAFDPLPEIYAAVERFRARRGAGAAWLHLDGAFGLWARAASSMCGLTAGSEHADSWATDAHKMLNVPYDCGIALCRHPRAQRRAMDITGAYLSSGVESAAINPGMFAPELSRRARGFALWAALRELGNAGIADLVERSAENARLFRDELALTTELEVCNDVVFNQVVVLPRPPAQFAEQDWNLRIVRALHADGTCYATPSIWRGKPVLRFSFSNADTTANDVRRSAAALLRVVEALRIVEALRNEAASS